MSVQCIDEDECIASVDSSLSFKPGRAEVNDFIGDFVSVGAAHGNPIKRRRRRTRRNNIMRRRRSLKRRKRKIKRRRTRGVEEVDAICVHVGGEEVVARLTSGSS